MARRDVKEKITRLVYASFRNLVERAPDSVLPAMLVADLQPLTRNLLKRKWADSEVVDDMQLVADSMQVNFEKLTYVFSARASFGLTCMWLRSLDEYSSEIESGHLRWSPPHRSIDFWKENAKKLEAGDDHLLKLLAHWLKTSTDPTVLAVAAHDVGKYLHERPDGRARLTRYGAKERTMELMEHPDGVVRFEALSAVQQFMSRAWYAFAAVKAN